MFDEENFNVFRDAEAVKEKQKVNRTKLPRKARNFSKEQLQLALRKKKECNAKAQKIVETLLESTDDVEAFLSMLKDINQSHYEDINEERAIQRICGYPLCRKELSNIPSQKYVISLSSKKVYDITERKNFCSGQCYKASNYIKGQMLTSPLWLRDQEDIPEFRLLGGPLSTPTTTAEGGAVFAEDLRVIERPVASSQDPEGPVGLATITDGRDNIREGTEVTLNAIDDIEMQRTATDHDDDEDQLEAKISKLNLKD